MPEKNIDPVCQCGLNGDGLSHSSWVIWWALVCVEGKEDRGRQCQIDWRVFVCLLLQTESELSVYGCVSST